jgi:biotin-(acetyl-CoA carboxylase) ligase
MWYDGLFHLLKQRIHTMGDVLELFQTYEVSSTNDWAWVYYEDYNDSPGCSTPCLFQAETQRSGRGTHQRTWVSPPNSGVYLSLLYPVVSKPLEVKETHTVQPLYSGLVALAVWLALVGYFPSLRDRLTLKNINDLSIDGAKLGGILVESRMTMRGHINALVMGVGLNLQPDETRHIADGRNTPTTLSEHITPKEKALMPTAFTLGSHIGMYMTAVCDLYHEGILNDVEAYLVHIRSCNNTTLPALND